MSEEIRVTREQAIKLLERSSTRLERLIDEAARENKLRPSDRAMIIAIYREEIAAIKMAIRSLTVTEPKMLDELLKDCTNG